MTIEASKKYIQPDYSHLRRGNFGNPLPCPDHYQPVGDYLSADDIRYDGTQGKCI